MKAYIKKKYSRHMRKLSKKLRKKIRKKAQSTHKLFKSIGRGLPERMMMSHRYVDKIAIGSVSGALGSYTFAANGMYDPDITGTGHQPIWFDQIGSYYNHYCVVGSKITVALANPVTGLIRVALVTDDNNSTSGYTGIESVSEQFSGTKILQLTPESGTKYLSRTFSLAKKFGKGLASESRFIGNAGANPTELSYYIIYNQADGGSTVSAYCTVTIEYTAIWSELKDIPPS